MYPAIKEEQEEDLSQQISDRSKNSATDVRSMQEILNDTRAVFPFSSNWMNDKSKRNISRSQID